MSGGEQPVEKVPAPSVRVIRATDLFETHQQTGNTGLALMTANEREADATDMAHQNLKE